MKNIYLPLLALGLFLNSNAQYTSNYVENGGNPGACITKTNSMAEQVGHPFTTVQVSQMEQTFIQVHKQFHLILNLTALL